MADYDIAIIGAGPAGLTAAIYTSRGGWKTAVIEKMGAGGQCALTDLIENYPGFPNGINGYELASRMQEQAEHFGAKFEFDTVGNVAKNPDGIFEIKTPYKTITARSVIIATGVSPKKLGVPGEDGFIGRGISFCATCDGAFYRGKTVAVIGGGDGAVEEAIFLTRFAEKVYIIHRRDALRATKVLQERAFNNPKIEIVWDSVVDKVNGKDALQSLDIKNVKTSNISNLEVNGMFIYIGGTPNTSAFPDVKKDDNGFIITESEMKTNIEGLFAVGDCRVKVLRQVSTAVGDGAVGADFAGKYLEETQG